MKEKKDLKREVREMAKKAKEASYQLSRLCTDIKNKALYEMADDLERGKDQLIEENERDLVAGERQSFTIHDGLIEIDTYRHPRDRKGAREVARLPDPVGEVVRMWKRPNSLMVGRMRIPIGVIGIIYESRPNVTTDAAGLCLKSGNSVM